MTMRLLQLPGDLVPLGKMLPECFQYPENETWSVQTDEKEQLIATVDYLRRIWPIISLMQLLSPQLRDQLRGFVWVEDSQLVGITIAQRRGSSDVWIVGTVGVLPAYRRRGIARKLVEAGLGLIQEHGGKKIFLDVIKDNIPAYALYKSLGFENYSGSVELQTIPEEVVPYPTLPKGYTQSPLKFNDWQPRYELEKRISPDNLLMYEPVEEDRYHQPAMMRFFAPLVMFAQGTKEDGFAVHTIKEGSIVAHGKYSVSSRETGINRVRLFLDPGHGKLASYLVRYLLHKVSELSPGRRIELSVPLWMRNVISASEGAGFKRRLEYIRMGLIV